MTDLLGASSLDVKACCAAVYGNDLVHLLLGGRLHPGGEELTRRLADLVGIGSGDRVLDAASGLGTTARLLSAERGATVRGVELSPRLVTSADRAAAEEGLGDLVSFEVGDAERLPVDDASFDVVLCECALCTFPDQAAAVAGFRRALGPGGRVGIADVTLERDRLPAELDTPIGRVACVAGALPPSGYERLLREGGFTDVVIEPHPEAALATVDSIRGGLDAARVGLRDVFDVEGALRLVDLAREAVHEGSIGYALITAKVENGPTAESPRGRDRPSG
ncbi:MAG: class I SAM-dependent methyltransferase [Actinomycetota bacterium]